MFKKSLLTEIDPKQLFLLDASGALLSAIMLGLVLTKLEPQIGMPVNILKLLALLACVFCGYSLSSYFRSFRKYKSCLRTIGIINLLYCCLTLVLIIGLDIPLTVLGWTYFILEIIIVMTLAIVELKTAAKLPANV